MAAGSPLEWVFRLIDQVSAPAKRMETQLSRLEKAIERNTEALNNAKSSSGSFRNALSAIELDSFVSLLGKAWSGLKALGDQFAKTVVGSLALKESTLASFEMILGSKEAAQDLFKEAAQLAKATPFGTKDVIETYSQLLSAGFKRQEVPILFQGLSDISALSDFDPAGMQSITSQLAQMKGKGVLRMDDLKPILNVSSKAGIGQEAIFAELAKELGTSPESIAAMESSGEISANRFIYAFMKTIANKKGGAVGNITKQQSETLRGLWSNFTSIPTDVVFGFAENLKGLSVLKGALKSIINLFDNSNSTGKRFQGVMERITDSLLSSIFGPISGQQGELALQAQLERLLDWAEQVDWNKVFGTLVHSLKDIATAARTVWTVLGPLLKFGHAAVAGTAEMAARLTTIGDWTPKMYEQAALENGRRARAGLQQGISASDVYNDAARLADTFRAGFAGPQGIDAHSPSRVFEELGEFTTAGYAKGIASGSGQVASTLSDLVASGGGGGKGITFAAGAVPINVNVSGGDAEDIARQIRPILIRELTAAVEGLGMQVGTEGAA